MPRIIACQGLNVEMRGKLFVRGSYILLAAVLIGGTSWGWALILLS